MLKDQFVILAAGQGTRLNHPILPKALAPFKGRFLIAHLLSAIAKIAKNQKPILVVGFMAEKVMTALGGRYEYVIQEPQLGTAHAVKAAQSKIKAENVLVLYADMPFISQGSLRRLMRMHHDVKANLSMFTAQVPDFKSQFSGFLHFGRVIRNFQKKIIKITEYRDAGENVRQIMEINPGIYMFNAQWLWKNIKKIKNKNVQQEYYLGDIVEIAIEQKEPVYSLPIPAREVIGINSREDLQKAERTV